MQYVGLKQNHNAHIHDNKGTRHPVWQCRSLICFNSSGQQWCSLAQTNKLYPFFIQRQYLWVGFIASYVFSMGFFENRKNIENQLIYPLKAWNSMFGITYIHNLFTNWRSIQCKSCKSMYVKAWGCPAQLRSSGLTLNSLLLGVLYYTVT